MQVRTNIMMMAAAAITLLLAAGASVAAQQAEKPPVPASVDPRAAQPERPTVATHAGTVAPGYLEIEAGIELDRFADASRTSIGTLVTKIGIASHLQLSLFSSVVKPSDSSGGFGDFGIGAKWRILDDHPVLGDFAVLPILTVPTGSFTQGSGTGTTAGSLWLISSRDLGPLHLDLNIAYSVNDGSGTRAPTSSWFWTMSWGGQFTPIVGWTVECYGVPGTGGAAGALPLVALLFGPTFTVQKSLVLDFGAIAPIAGQQPRAFFAGVTYNVGRLW